MKWECKIEKAKNGFIVTTYDEYEEDKIMTKKNVFMSDNTEIEDKEIEDVFSFIAEYFGIHNSKHNKNNLEIKWKKNKFD